MGADAIAPVIIKRKKVSGGDGHHGGAWKVAYADFVTAMMAFFMLMWLLNATTEQQRKGIADYFSPTVPINRVSGGGDGMFGGSDIMSDMVLAEMGTGENKVGRGKPSPRDTTKGNGVDTEDPMVGALIELQETLLGKGGESFLSEKALRHVITRLTDEGLVIEIFDREDASVFDGASDEPEPVMVEIIGGLARVFGTVKNGVAVGSYVAARPVILRSNPKWELSSARAGRVRAMLENGGLPTNRFSRVTGYADTKRATENPMAPRNNWIEIILLRSDQ